MKIVNQDKVLEVGGLIKESVSSQDFELRTFAYPFFPFAELSGKNSNGRKRKSVIILDLKIPDFYKKYE